MKYFKLVVCAAVSVLLLGTYLNAQDISDTSNNGSIKENFKNMGNSIGDSAENVTKSIGHDSRNIVDDNGEGSLKENFKNMGESIGEAARDITRSIGHGSRNIVNGN